MGDTNRVKSLFHQCRVCLPLVALTGAAFLFMVLPIYRYWNALPPKESATSTPNFTLSSVGLGEPGLSSRDMTGALSLVNVWASWCRECRLEHPFFMDLARRKVVPVYGLNYRDAGKDARAWLRRNGNPYVRTGADTDGLVAAAWGVYGVPETLLVDGNGRVVHRHSGALTPATFDDHFLPLIEKVAGR